MNARNMDEDWRDRTVTKFGYRRLAVGRGRQRFEHVLVWEAHYGPVPPGMEVHHRNENKLDNRIENLVVLTRLSHKRIHSGCVYRDGDWWKRCRRCGELKPVTTGFYIYPGRSGVMGVCRRCAVILAVEYKRRRRVARRQSTVATQDTPAEMAGVGEGGKRRA
jgi:hypothetical protein